MTEARRRDRYDILFEPVRIGPVTARNRFYQVPQCAGMGDTWINGQIRHREIKAEGGWAVVNTELCEIHHTSHHSYPCMHLWDESDVRRCAALVDAIHRHGALAGIELGHMGNVTANGITREPPIGASCMPVSQLYPTQCRAMDKSDIRAYLDWQRAAARRAREAGFDIIYADASGVDGPPLSFMSRRYNQRTDEYGGSIENRVRLLREYIEVTREGAGPDRAVAVRICIDELLGPDGITVEEEGLAVMELCGEMPDLWDINVSDWENDSLVSRFGKEGSQERFASFVKQRTSKPVVGVGRFTSPDSMVSVIRRGVQDFIGAARPSIADPFLPKKIEEGRLEDVRECIGCNICVSGFMLNHPSRCTQNPTTGDEWRRGWHPERIAPRRTDACILIVGGGPSGLECAHALGKRGYRVTVADARTQLGGRVVDEARLPGLAEWIRVRDYRAQQFAALPNVEVFLNNTLTAADVLESGSEHVVIATGAVWRRDGLGRTHAAPIPGSTLAHVLTPDDVFEDRSVAPGPVLVYDDDHYYLGNVIAERLRLAGHEVTIATPLPELSKFTYFTQEHRGTLKRMYEIGVEVLCNQWLAQIGTGQVLLRHTYSGRETPVECTSVILVTSRLPVDRLYYDLSSDPARLERAGILSITRIGDCLVPSTIAAAVWTGHRYARELDEPPVSGVPFRREMTPLQD